MKKENPDEIFNLPNIISLLRITAIPFLILLLIKPDRFASILAAAIFAIVSISDIIDGYIARVMGLVTNMGKFLDPLADKLIIATALIMLIPLKRVPAWIVTLIILREITVTGIRAIAAERGIIIAASPAGKYKTAFQTVALIFLLFHYPFLNINIHIIGIALLWIALFFTLWSGFEYVRYFLKETKKKQGT